jgi:hypothetical protein
LGVTTTRNLKVATNDWMQGSLLTIEFTGNKLMGVPGSLLTIECKVVY